MIQAPLAQRRASHAWRRWLGLLTLIGLVAGCGTATNAPLRVAVAANFASVAEQLASEFQAIHDLPVEITLGSTGQLTAQILQGAPFDVLLAADVARPKQLEQAQVIVPDSRRTYAHGRLVFWAPGLAPQIPKGQARYLPPALTVQQIMQRGELNSLSLANWKLAPYGEAARITLSRLSLASWLGLPPEDTESGPDAVATGETLASQPPPKLVTAQNVGQVYALVASGSVDAAFVAAAQLVQVGQMAQLEKTSADSPGLQLLMPPELHPAIEQQAVLLTGEQVPEAAAFYEFLFSARAREIISTAGYDLPEIVTKAISNREATVRD